MKVFYDERQSTACNESMSPSAGKPRLVVEDWRQRGFPIEIAPVDPVTEEQLQLIHDPEYVHGVLSGERANGFGNCLTGVAETLLWTSGSLLSAAEFAIGSGESVCSPTSGFHHAGFSEGGGFCTFNALALAVFLFAGRGQRVGIVDLDEHYGDGTQELLDRFEGSGQVSGVPHLTLGAVNSKLQSWSGEGDTTERVDAWLDDLGDELRREFSCCDLVIYQAGADSHIDDPLGGTFNTEQYKRRDHVVFEAFHDLGIPLVWNLAGGYQTPVEKVVELHAFTAAAFIERYESGSQLS